jgi:hypothetical protein
MAKKLRKWITAKPTADDALATDRFELPESPIAELAPRQALVRVKLINIHSATRLRIVQGITGLGNTDVRRWSNRNLRSC